MKVAVILYHSNVNRYPQSWIKACVDSIRNQTYKHFMVYELDYGGTCCQVYQGSMFYSKKLQDHACAHNYLLKKVFKLGYQCAFNVNIDDFYHPQRFEKQLEYIRAGFDVVSSNYVIVDGFSNEIGKKTLNDLDFAQEAAQNHNIIAHPVLCYSNRFDGQLISSEIPRDDFELWKRLHAQGKFKHVILPDYLLYYRVHQNKVS